MELWDAYKSDGTLAGSTLVRGEKIPEGLCHAVSEVFVMHEDGSILLMQRDFNKPNYPGCWESGAGGAVKKGESFEKLADEVSLDKSSEGGDIGYFTKDTFGEGFKDFTEMAFKTKKGNFTPQVLIYSHLA